MTFRQIITLMIVAIVALVFTTACTNEDNKSNLTKVSLRVIAGGGSGKSLTSGSNNSRSAISSSRLISVKVIVTAPDLSEPFIKEYGVSETQNGVISLMVPTGRDRTFTVYAFEEATTLTNNAFPGTSYVPANTPAERTLNLTGTPVYIAMPLTFANSYTLSGTLNDDRLGSMNPLGQGCAGTGYLANAVFTDTGTGLVLQPITLDVGVGGTYSISGIPYINSFELLVGAAYSGAAGLTLLPESYDPAAPGVVNRNIDLVGYTQLSITPPSAILAPSATQTFQVSGGQGGYSSPTTLGISSFNSGLMGPLSLDPADPMGTTYNYTAPSSTFVSDVLTATDLCGDIATALVSETLSQCNDTVDNDGDTQIDFPNDPGCATPTDNNELGTNECDDGVDNDADTFIDFPADPECPSLSGTSEVGTPACSDGLDNDGDTLTDFPADPGCEGGATDTTETNAAGPECDDGIDNDADTLMDLADGSCTAISDVNEGTNACDDGIDNDLDTTTDFPADPGCTNIDDVDELGVNQCDNGLDDDGDTVIDVADPGCLGNPAGVTETGACQDAADNDGDTFTDFPADPGCTSAADIDELGLNECDDGLDNDGDTLIDLADTACATPADLTETGACQDTLDNDGDTFADFPADPGCTAATDIDELGVNECDDGIDNDGDVTIDVLDPGCLGNPAGLTETGECQDTVDNDGDTLTDFPADPGCTAASDASEFGVNQCDDGADNDADTAVDLADPGCLSNPAGLTEVGECQDTIDNDGDTLIDFPADTDCISILGITEQVPTECNDTLDNDGDTFSDLADLGCMDFADLSELGLNECDDGIDNDGDTFIDFTGSDPECITPWDLSEIGAAAIQYVWGANPNPVPDGTMGNPWKTIADAMLVVPPFGDIYVATGTYSEAAYLTKYNVSLFGGWDSTFGSYDPLLNLTTLNPPGTPSAVIEGVGVGMPTVDGFEITGGIGAGISFTNSSPTISNSYVHNVPGCGVALKVDSDYAAYPWLSDLTIEYVGGCGGIYSGVVPTGMVNSRQYPLIEYVSIKDTVASREGLQTFTWATAPGDVGKNVLDVHNSYINVQGSIGIMMDATANGGGVATTAVQMLQNSIIRGSNTGIYQYVYSDVAPTNGNAYINIENSTIAYSTSNGMYTYNYASWPGTVNNTIRNSIFANNSFGEVVNVDPTETTVDYSDFWPGVCNCTPGVGVQAVDPMFIPANLYLDIASTLIDAGDPNPAYNDVSLPPGQGTFANDMGAYGGPYASMMVGTRTMFTGGECNDTIDNDGDTNTDFPSDTGCLSAVDPSELGTAECDDGIDNDGDTFIDFAGSDPECASPAGLSENPGLPLYVWVDNTNPVPDGTSVNPWTTIAAGLAAAAPGDTLNVALGTYNESIVLPVNVSLQGGWDSGFSAVDPVANRTIISPSTPVGAAITGTSVGMPVIDGFEITGGNYQYGMEFINSGPMISNNYIHSATTCGLRFYVNADYTASPSIHDNTITNLAPPGDCGIKAEAFAAGPGTFTFLYPSIYYNLIDISPYGASGGIWLDASALVTGETARVNATIRNTFINGSQKGVKMQVYAYDMAVANSVLDPIANTIIRNTTYGFFVVGDSTLNPSYGTTYANIENNTFVQNTTGLFPTYYIAPGQMNFTIRNSIFHQATNHDPAVVPGTVVMTALYSDFFNPGVCNNCTVDPSNMFNDPLFNSEFWDMTLQGGSTLIDQGDPNVTYNDAQPPGLSAATNDMGAYGGPNASVLIGTRTPFTQCTDGLDNDGDTKIDFDGGDLECMGPGDDDELSP